MKVREILKTLHKDGWREKETKGSAHSAYSSN
jgi:hypothetical protein